LSDLDIVVRSVSLKRETLNKADTIVKQRKIPGVNNRSGLIEYALQKVFKELADEQRQKCQ
jgi:metal-responsive CopG/Arc/MetJ family transcriptional regulator